MSELRLVVRLWLHPETNIAEYEAFERKAAELMKSHTGKIERVFRSENTQTSDEPFEIHLVVFPDEAAFEAYRSDSRIATLAQKRERLISRTEIWRGAEVNYGF